MASLAPPESARVGGRGRRLLWLRRWVDGSRLRSGGPAGQTRGAKETWRVAAILAVLVAAMGLIVSNTPRANESLQHLGGEYFNIARALTDGRGFSDPFGEHTGPTAWMPPLYPLLLAGILWLLKTRALTASVVVFLRSVGHVLTGAMIYAVARRRHLRIPPWLPVAFFALWSLVFVDWTFYLTHDVWLLGFGALGVLRAIDGYDADGRVRSVWWGTGIGALLLASPVLGFAAAVTTAAALGGRRAHFWHWVRAFGLAAAIVAPWAVRNRIVFHENIPVKSNLYYDIYKANFADDDGLWDLESMSQHPYANVRERFIYAKEGETKYVAKFKDAFWTSVRGRFREYARKVRTRLLAETIVYPPVFAHERGLRLWAARIVYPLPFLGTLLGLAWPSRNRRFAYGCAIFTATYLGSYALVAYYVRYLLPLTPVLIAASFCGLDAALARLCPTSAPLEGADETGPTDR